MGIWSLFWWTDALLDANIVCNAQTVLLKGSRKSWNYFVWYHVHVTSSINWGVKPHQNRPSKSPILAGYQILNFTLLFTYYKNLVLTFFQNKNYPYYNLRYNPSAPFIRSGFLVSYRIRSAMKFSQNVLHYILHTSRVYVIHIKSLSRYFQLTQNWTDKAKWRSIEASNNINKHTGLGLLAVLIKLVPRIKFALVKFNSTDGSTWQFVHSAAVPMALF